MVPFQGSLSDHSLAFATPRFDCLWYVLQAIKPWMWKWPENARDYGPYLFKIG